MYHYPNIDQDFLLDSNSDSQDVWSDIEPANCAYHQTFDTHNQLTKSKKPLREKNSGKHNGYKHVPHSEKPPQVVAKRNARERRRVQAVNNAFVKLKNAVPIQNVRGKRISKVKTLLYAIDYIRTLDNILQECGSFSSSFETMECVSQKHHLDYDISGNWTYKRDHFPVS